MFGKTTSRTVAVRRAPRPVMERLDVRDLHFPDRMPEGRMVDLAGRGRTFVRVAEGPADAPAVLLVHGLFATSDLNWSLAIPALAGRFRVVAPDLRGHGRGLATRRFCADECADDLAAIVEAMELGPVIVTGYSLGGVVAQVFARRYPHLVKGMVLCATASSFQMPAARGLLRVVDWAARRAPERLRRAAMMAALAPRSAETPRGRWLMSQVRSHDTRALLDAVAEVARFNSTDWFISGTCPAAVVVTTRDRTVPAEAQRSLSRCVNGSVREVDGDHFACIKRPAEFNAALFAACAQVAS